MGHGACRARGRAHVVEVGGEAVGARLLEFGLDVVGLVVHRRDAAEGLDKVALVLAAADAHDLGTGLLGQLAHERADRARRAGHNERVARLDLEDPVDSGPCCEADDAVHDGHVRLKWYSRGRVDLEDDSSSGDY